MESAVTTIKEGVEDTKAEPIVDRHNEIVMRTIRTTVLTCFSKDNSRTPTKMAPDHYLSKNAKTSSVN